MEWLIRNWKVKPEQMFRLDGKVALVTGGASGIGRAIALGLDAFGANVVIADIDGAGAQRVADELSQEGMVIETDVTKAVDVAHAVSKTVETFGGVDISFNIPGINVRKPAVELSEAEWRSVVEVNLTGVFICAREVGKVMLERGQGSMINMASARGIAGGASQSVYSATKAGVIHLTKCLAIEWAPNVRVNALAPGYLKTPLVREIMEDKEWSHSTRRLHAMKRFGEPEEVVGAAVFLASDASTFVTGTAIAVDGGWTAGGS
jgi:NAD(P)-dependent dehydrogenase (short-subunit alcohol dehydrogenase family)